MGDVEKKIIDTRAPSSHVFQILEEEESIFLNQKQERTQVSKFFPAFLMIFIFW